MNEYVKVLALRREFPQIGIGKVKTALTEAEGDIEVARFYLTTYAEGLTFKLLAIHSTPDQEGRKLENLRKSIARDIADFVKNVDTHTEQEDNLPESEGMIYKSKEERNVVLMEWLRPYVRRLAFNVKTFSGDPQLKTRRFYALDKTEVTADSREDEKICKLIVETVKVYNFEKTELGEKELHCDVEILEDYYANVVASLASLGVGCSFTLFDPSSGMVFVELYVEDKDVEKFKYLVLQGAKSNE